MIPLRVPVGSRNYIRMPKGYKKSGCIIRSPDKVTLPEQRADHRVHNTTDDYTIMKATNIDIAKFSLLASIYCSTSDKSKAIILGSTITYFLNNKKVNFLQFGILIKDLKKYLIKKKMILDV